MFIGVRRLMYGLTLTDSISIRLCRYSTLVL